MLKTFNQESLVKLIGYIIVPILIVVPFFFINPFRYNYTVLLNQDNAWIFYLSELPVLCFYACLLYKIGKQAFKNWNLIFILQLICVISIMFVPYSEDDSSFSSNLHLIFAYGSLVFLNIILFQLLMPYSKLRTFYYALLFLSFLVAVTLGILNGIAELIYGINLSITLTTLYKIKTI